jgi:hypothetical protein
MCTTADTQVPLPIIFAVSAARLLYALFSDLKQSELEESHHEHTAYNRLSIKQLESLNDEEAFFELANRYSTANFDTALLFSDMHTSHLACDSKTAKM